MVKKTLKLLSLLVLAGMSAASVAFADVPDPHGVYHRRPAPEYVEQFWIFNESHDSSYSQEQIAITLHFKAPEGAQVEYDVKNAEGEIILRGIENHVKNNGKILLLFDKPKPKQSYTIQVNASCHSDRIKTPFGIKKSGKPDLCGEWSKTYKIIGNANGYVDIEDLNNN